MPDPWAHLDDLIRELGEIGAIPLAHNEPALTEATIAVSKAADVLARASPSREHARSRRAVAMGPQLAKAIAEARQALARARASLEHRGDPRDPGPRAPVPAASGRNSEKLAGAAEAHCHSCGLDFVVRYTSVVVGEMVAMPVPCPSPDCDGVTEVAYPAAASVQVVPVRG